MQIKSDLLKYYNQFFANHTEFTLSEPFVEQNDPDIYFGILHTKNAKIELELYVSIPLNFPYHELIIHTKSIKGYNHLIYQNEEIGSWFCLNTPFVEGIEERLKIELKKLTDWIDTYINQGLKDDHYDYIIAKRDPLNCLYFSEMPEDYNDERFKENRFGEFYKYNLKDANTGIIQIAENLGNKLSSWAKPYSRDSKTQGYWIFLENEPISTKSTLYDMWDEMVLEQNFPTEFINLIEDQFNRKNELLNQYSNRSVNINAPLEITDYLKFTACITLDIAIGYCIPSKDNIPEIHWELVTLTYSSGKVSNELEWHKTINISKARFFGRGGFCDVLTNYNTLIIGVGAVGSSLAEILVRGGVTQITLLDKDSIEPGNICRGNFHFTSSGNPKVSELRNRLINISPFANINIVIGNLSAVPSFEDKYIEIKEDLNKYDLIIDCTASNEVLHFLSNIERSKLIISLCITDKSSHMLCLTNTDKDNLYDKRKIALYAFGETAPATFYEGAGCYYPTFQAAFFDINALLNSTLRKINRTFSNADKLNSFYTSYEGDNILCYEYKVLYQVELNFSLTISEDCIGKIFHFSKLFYPSEYGGVMVGGYSDNRKSIYITDVLVPNKYSNSSISFQADHSEINKEIERLHDKTGGSIMYLGDWHSHPEMSNDYSNVDFKSIERQAKSTSVSINNPIMAIVSIGRNNFEIGYYIYFEGKLYKFSENQ